MISVLSATEHDYYCMPLPFVVYSWHKLNIGSIVFIPNEQNAKMELAKKYCFGKVQFHTFRCADFKIPTYSQVVRLFGAAIPELNENEILITGDGDMAVFNNDYFNQFNNENINVIGHDLTPSEQYPMCYCSMPVYKWRNVFNINKSYQEHLEEIIDPIQSTNLRGDAWCLDQFLLKKQLNNSGFHIIIHPRSNGQNQFATRRADRDGWHFSALDIVDAHLPRPLTDDENFNKVYNLFSEIYPNDDLTWMKEYQKQYKELL